MPRAKMGAIAMAVYEPDPELFVRQIRSLAQQTLGDFTCVISPDSDAAPIAALLHEAAPGDDRFRIIDTGGRRLGFYLNFERALAAVDRDAAWIALADQDDWWYPTKLEELVPLLEQAAMVSGQARLVEHPSGTVLGLTARRDASLERLALSNQFTGSLSVFRTELLETALPFPRMETRAAAHDHWLAVCAAATGGTRITEDVVQDYVQHSANVFGDPASMQPRKSVLASIRGAREMSVKTEGRGGIIAIARTTLNVYVGWRELMTRVLEQRVGRTAPLASLDRLFGRGRRLRAFIPFLRQALREGYVPRPFAVQYLASWACGVVMRRRRRRPT